MSDRSDRHRSAVTFPLPPPDFDPLTAPDYLLRRHGVPRRPDAEREPKAWALWQRIFSRDLTFIQPELRPAEWGNGRPRRRGPDFGSGDWAGEVLGGAPGAGGIDPPAIYVSAEWGVPSVPEVDPDGSVWPGTVAFWVGLDGADSGELLQAGVAAQVVLELVGPDPEHLRPVLLVDWYAWAEWYTDEFKDPPWIADGFSVSPGDLVTVLVCAFEPTLGQIFIVNLTTNHCVPFAIPAPKGFTSVGTQVEWVVEQVDDRLPTFTPVTFYNCAAGSLNSTVQLRPGPGRDIYDGSYDRLTYSWVLTEDSVMVRWAAAGDGTDAGGGAA